MRQEVKEEAKQLLLKGCYKMASNKYRRLIEEGAEGFAQREWAVIHLNRGICLQFMADHWYMHRRQLADSRRAAGLHRMGL